MLLLWAGLLMGAGDASSGPDLSERATPVVLPISDVVVFSDRARVTRKGSVRLTGGVQVVARVVETGLHKMDALGFDVTRVVSAMGTAPLPPTARDDARAIGRTNDCILYGGQARYVVRATDEELAALVGALPACASPDHGTPFHEIFTRHGGDFYAIDPRLFSPAEVWLTSATSGRTFHAGRLEPDVLRMSLFER